VGHSGVGKTKIVEAIRTLRHIAIRADINPTPMTWNIEFEHNDNSYVWEGQIDKSVTSTVLLIAGEALKFARENLWLNGERIIQRQNGALLLNNNPVPQLRSSESVLSLFAEDPNVVQARHAFLNIAFVPGNEIQHDGSAMRNETQRESLKERCAAWIKQRSRSSLDERFVLGAVAALVDAGKDSAALHAFLVRQVFPERFATIKDYFCEIFTSIVDVTVDFGSELKDGGNRLVIQLAIKERGYDQWILQPQISSGMLRTLLHLFAVDAALPGAVLVVDEFENSLGKNCLPHMTDTLLEHIGEVQFILTSHHPYVISKIPIDCWQLVRRRGSTVTLTSARDIPALMDESHHEAFIRLLNLDEYENGIEPVDGEKS
ncbi:MAG TPA: AAA family ATPase, partial [Polyangium sp.]|nr:AAA family ATPase [Polyangium sp.]